MFRLRFIPLGGIVGVTKNMYVYELYEDDRLKDILIVDCGIGFPKVQEFGIDHEIPDVSYLLDKTDKIRAILFTHGHEDHISALRFHYQDLGRPPVYASKLTSTFIMNKFNEYKIPIHVNQITYGKDYTFGHMSARYIRMTHSIPDTTHILIKTPVGAVYHGSDFKIDLTPPYGPPPDFYEIAKAGHDGVMCLLTDSLGSDREGYTESESTVGQTFEDEIRSTKGKFIMTTFASNISRVRQCAEAAVKFNRKVCLLGRSMKVNSKSAKDIGYFPINEKFLIDEKEVKKFKPEQVCIIATGSQGQFGSALSRIAMDQHKFIRITPGDKVLFSSDPIPGNEETIYEVIEQLYLLGADVRYSDIHEQLHVSGHGNQGDLKLLLSLVKPQHIIPIGGTIRHQRHYLGLANQMGYQDKNVHLLTEGQTMWFEKNRVYPGDEVKTKSVYVDGYGVGKVGDSIIRDRMTLSKEGAVFVLLQVDLRNQLVAKPEFNSHGFVFDNDRLFVDATEETIKVFEERSRQHKDSQEYSIYDESLKKDVIGHLERFFLKATNKKPLVAVHLLRV